MKWTRAEVAKLQFRATMFGDGEKGSAMQCYVCEQIPELTVVANRESRDHDFERWFCIGEHETQDADELAKILTKLKAVVDTAKLKE